MSQIPSGSSEYPAIKKLDFIEEYFCFEEIESTNDFAKNQKFSPSSGLIVIRALKQSSGRGRRDKSFFSDDSGGLWVSIVAPVKSIADHFTYNRAISLAVCGAIENTYPQINEKIKIKWPNDIYCGDRKIAGVLLENTSANPDAIIVGLGLNVNMALSDFPAKLRKSATSLFIETGQLLPINQLLESILLAYWRFIGTSDQQSIHRQYVNRLYKKGRRAAVDSQQGTFLTVEPNGQLRMQTAGSDLLYSSGTLTFL